MTHEEKKQIGKMRAAGMSYTRIAEALDISINSVKSYCRSIVATIMDVTIIFPDFLTGKSK